MNLEIGDRVDALFIGNDNSVPHSQARRIDGLLVRFPTNESPYFILAVTPDLDGCEDGSYYCTVAEILGTLPISSDPAEVEKWLTSTEG